MLPSPQSARRLAASALGALLLGACGSEPTSPRSGGLRVTGPGAPQAAQAFPEKCGKHAEGVMAFGLTHYPGHRTQLSVTESGHLTIASTAKGANDEASVCTPMPGYRGAEIDVVAPGVGLQPGGTVTWRSCMVPMCGGWAVEVHREPDGDLEMFMDYTDDLCMYTIVATRNGEPVASTTGSGRTELPLPAGFRITGWATFPSTFRLDGGDGSGNTYRITATLSDPSACAAGQPTPTGMAMIFQFRGLDGPPAVTLDINGHEMTHG